MKRQNWKFPGNSREARFHCKLQCSENVLKTANSLQEVNMLNYDTKWYFLMNSISYNRLLNFETVRCGGY